MKSAIDQARIDLQQLHKDIDARTEKNHAAIRADLERAAAEAQRLAASLKTLSDAQRIDAKQHLKNAIGRLEDASKCAKDLAAASDVELRAKNKAMLDKLRAALQSLSRSIAAQRAGISRT